MRDIDQKIERVPPMRKTSGPGIKETVLLALLVIALIFILSSII